MCAVWMVWFSAVLFLFPAILAADDPAALPQIQKVVDPIYTPIATPRGVRPHIPFETGQIDHIDTSSGNLTVRIPLGQTYTVGPHLSYRFQVVHNSNAWDFVRADWADDGFPGDLILPLANPGSNAGLGWELHFGKLFAPLDQRPTGLEVRSRTLRNSATSNSGATNPLNGTRYTGKVRQQMRPSNRTGRPDNHGFLLEVDGLAGQGTTRPLTGGDGVVRTKVELRGTYRNREGTFEWIVEPDGAVNHRLFVPDPK